MGARLPASSFLLSRISDSSRRGRGSKKAVSWKGVWWGKGQKRFHSPCSWPPQICLQIRLCWKSVPGSPSPKRQVASCNAETGVPSGLPCSGGEDSLTVQDRFMIGGEHLSFSGAKGIFFSSPANLLALKGHAAFPATHPCSQDPPAGPQPLQPVCPEPSCPNQRIQTEGFLLSLRDQCLQKAALLPPKHIKLLKLLQTRKTKLLTNALFKIFFLRNILGAQNRTFSILRNKQHPWELKQGFMPLQKIPARHARSYTHRPLASSKKLLSVGALVVSSQARSVYFVSKKVSREAC